jgi:glucose/arabinose dehydrogenase
MSSSTRKAIFHVLLFCLCGAGVELSAQPSATRTDITIKEVATVSRNAVRIRQDPASGNLYVLEMDGDIRRVSFDANGMASFTTVYSSADHGVSAPLGMAFGQDGALFLVGNQSNASNPQLGTATIVKGIPDSPGGENRTWKVLAKTVDYLFGFTYNHKMSAVVVDQNGDYIYVNSGARTDHGEVREGVREVGLTAIILKLPTNGENITLQDDREWLRTNGYLMAEGIRNIFDMAYAGNGDLFSVENCGDRDDPEEMNWVREGHHYGFPWRMGGNDTPQQFTPYDPRNDPLLSPNAWGGGQGQLYITFSNDPTYPPRPNGVTFTEPVLNAGPDADKFRDPQTGAVKDASALGVTNSTFTTHRSPNGIVFDKDSVLVEDLAGGGFVISLNNGGLLRALGDTGEDLLHVALTKNSEDGYRAQVTRLVSGFRAPLGIELVNNKLYVLETGLWAGNNSPKLWEITLPPGPTVGVDTPTDKTIPTSFRLDQNYPNPFNPATTIHFEVASASNVKIIVYDILGKAVRTLVDRKFSPGGYSESWNGRDNNNRPVVSGVYVVRMQAGDFVAARKIVLVK